MFSFYSEAWLRAAELTPTWIWALVDLPETMHTNYAENTLFVGIIQQVRIPSKKKLIVLALLFVSYAVLLL